MAEKKTIAKKAPAKWQHREDGRPEGSEEDHRQEGSTEEDYRQEGSTEEDDCQEGSRDRKSAVIISFEEIQLAAYLRAEAAGFSGDPIGHWLEAEATLRKGA